MNNTRTLDRRLGLSQSILLGLGSMIGTGVFVSLGVAADVAGSAVVLATMLAALLATANALNSAQLAAAQPVSGGTYEYGYRYLTPWLGFSAGWMFVCAKSASAAAAALGFAGYVAIALQLNERWSAILAAGAVVAVTILVYSGMRRSSRANTVIVSITLAALAAFCFAGMPGASQRAADNFVWPAGSSGSTAAFLQATALMFVAFTGYGRIATLGEEVIEPHRTIPKAIVATLVIAAVLYVAVAAVAIASVGAARLAEATTQRAAPLAVVAREFDVPGLPAFVAVGAVTAMLGVLLNLILGVSRVILAMARRGDLPMCLSQVDDAGGSPGRAVLLTGACILALTLTGGVKTTWSFSAFTVLVYYAVTNLAALRLPTDERLYPKWLAVAGLAGCLSLAFFVEPAVWMTGLAVLAVGLVWHAIRRR